MPNRDRGDRQGNFFRVCRNCKVSYACCHGTRPPITKERQQIIEAYLRKERIPAEEVFVEEGYVFPREGPEGYCIFHDMKTRRCKVHPVKPETCVAGPLTFDVDKQSGRIEWYMKMERICPLAGTINRDEQLLQKHLKSARKEISRFLQKLPLSELNIILAKDEPETCKLEEANS